MNNENDCPGYREEYTAESAPPASAAVASELDDVELVDSASSPAAANGQEPVERRSRAKFPEFEPEDETFPWQVLPETIRGAVIEICRNDKVAVPIAVQAVISAVSLSCQDLIWIDRGIGEKSVCSLYMLSVTDTGARKSRADGTVTSAIEVYDREKRAEYTARIEEGAYLSKERRRTIAELEKDSRAWRRQIRTLTIRGQKDDNNTVEGAKAELEEVEHRLAELRREESGYREPRLQRVLYSKIPIRQLEQSLAENWPSAGLFSDEAAGILNARGESDMSSLDKLWEGKAIDVVGRTARESFFIEDPRLTMSLMVQPIVFDRFLERKGELAKGIGFMSRVLLSRPDTPYGKRTVDTSVPRLTEWTELFNNRVRALLSHGHSDIALRSRGRKTLYFSQTAQQAWEKDFNEMERATADDGKLVYEREFVNRYGEHVARLAALFHFFERGKPDSASRPDDAAEREIPEATVTSAIRVVEWYLNEFKRVFNPEVAMREMARYVLKRLKQMLDEKNGGQLREPLGIGLDHTNCRIPYHELRARCPRYGLKKTEKFDQVVKWLEGRGNIAIREKNARQAGAGKQEPKSVEIKYTFKDWRGGGKKYAFHFDL
ncbi:MULTISPECIES: YfjI family protein [Burkholderia cepacia complex]|uniref:YfjI family protein n=1 Tax=Burkholderia cepacia complex TaxID=87882 RepID=UPI0009B515D5|nr:MULTISPECIES: YfjI family protein [Burkholderia cepacia complex]